LSKHWKHIEVYFHFVYECVEESMIDIVKIESENNIADILTKSQEGTISRNPELKLL